MAFIRKKHLKTCSITLSHLFTFAFLDPFLRSYLPYKAEVNDSCQSVKTARSPLWLLPPLEASERALSPIVCGCMLVLYSSIPVWQQQKEAPKRVRSCQVCFRQRKGSRSIKRDARYNSRSFSPRSLSFSEDGHQTNQTAKGRRRFRLRFIGSLIEYPQRRSYYSLPIFTT